jgi:nucleoid-associated protein YgaU
MLNKNLALIILVVFAAGCGTEVRTYVMTKDRVGLDQGSGNGGCVVGKCPPQPAPKETTRKVYVLELTKPVPESEVQKIEATAVDAITETTPTPPVADVTPAPSAPAASDNAQPAPAAQPVIPVIGDEPAAAPTAPQAADQNAGSVQSQTYTVQKDDTLQKISKKIFGSYGKWYKIYEANKSKIKNPNILKPGTVLTIPAVK